MVSRIVHEKVMIACVTREVTLITQPAIENNIDRIHLIHYIKKDDDSKEDRSKFYQMFYDENVKVLEQNGIEVVEHSDSEVYKFHKMMVELYSILSEEIDVRKNYVYINLSSGTPEYSAAAAITGMMFKDVELYSVGKDYDGMVVDYDHLLESSKFEGKLVGSCRSISGMWQLEKYPIGRPDLNLLKAFKVYSVLSDLGLNSNSNVIRNLILTDVWLSTGDSLPKSAIKGTSVELEKPENGHSCSKLNEIEYTHRQRGEAVQYYRSYVSKWLANGWIENVSGTKKYRITKEGKNALEIFCPFSLIDFKEGDVVLQSKKYV